MCPFDLGWTHLSISQGWTTDVKKLNGVLLTCNIMPKPSHDLSCLIIGYRSLDPPAPQQPKLGHQQPPYISIAMSRTSLLSSSASQSGRYQQGPETHLTTHLLPPDVAHCLLISVVAIDPVSNISFHSTLSKKKASCIIIEVL